jgi:putative hemolysin
MIYFIIPLLLVILQGVFAASETGLISLEKTHVLKAKREKKLWAIRVSYFLKRPARFFSTILVSENFIIVIASTLFAKFFIDQVGDNGAIISTIVLSLFTLTVGLFVPKSIALSYPGRVMSYLANPIFYNEIITYPIVSLYAFISKGLAYLLRIKTGTDSIQRMDIIHAISEYEEEARKLASRLFNFSKRTIGEIMIPLGTAFACRKGAELETLTGKNKRIFTRIPIYQNKKSNIVGVFNIKDFFYEGKIVLREPFFVNLEDRCMTIFTTMKQKGEHMAIVRNSQGTVVGIVTLEDLLEELVGEIRDEP